MAQLLFRDFKLLEPEIGELQGGYELLVEGETVKENSDAPIKATEYRRHRLRRAHAHAGPDRQPWEAPNHAVSVILNRLFLAQMTSANLKKLSGINGG